ncbi:16S rRNA (uracil(1498)-N(3))-methyltransferase [Aciduricibacillus chroicocephali]|uniref:Ribosomal RNA small subunit methyltransferase E n=1 Tax=Aciduricibacillus chroicocephali TaxID=3054939 RepID=A0ABY9KS78_9BACI|nr:16S rRNA (uracil(1498)-N(3))-methyltransferase [Bacillaceae bacterium 44XB]
MQRYFVPESSWSGDKVIVKGNDARHISRVMRMKPGDKVFCNHPDGRAALCMILTLRDTFIELLVEQWMEQSAEMPVHVTIAQAIPKGDKFELVLQKGTELGAGAFIPFQADRSVAVWDEKKIDKKQPRFDKIVKEASEQSHRNHVPAVEPPVSSTQLAELSKEYDIAAFAYEEEARSEVHHSFAKVLHETRPGMRMLICIGPEGGYSDREVELFKEAGMKPVRLGPRILRTETAALYALAGISYHLEELRC